MENWFAGKTFRAEERTRWFNSHTKTRNMKRIGTAFTANQTAAIRARYAPIDIVVKWRLQFLFLFGTTYLTRGAALGVLETLDLRFRELHTTSSQTFFT